MSETKIAELIFTAIGQASMCWEFNDRGGVFGTEQAIKVGEDLIAALKPYLNDGIRRITIRRGDALIGGCEIKHLLPGDLFLIDESGQFWQKCVDVPYVNEDGVFTVLCEQMSV